MLRIKMLISLFLVNFIAMLILPLSAYATNVPLDYFQEYSSDVHGDDREVHYCLERYDDPSTAIDEGQGSLPDGSVNGKYDFTLTASERLTISLTVPEAGTYFYKAYCTEPARDNYTYDDTIFIAKLYVKDVDLQKKTFDGTLYCFEDGTKVYDPGWTVSYKAPTYKVTDMEGNPVIRPDDNGTIKFIGTGDYDKFVELYIDGKKIDPSLYTVEKGPDGQTIIILSDELAEKLASGKHTIKMSWEDGEAEGLLEIPEAASVIPTFPSSENVDSIPQKIQEFVQGTIPKLGEQPGLLCLCGFILVGSIVVLMVVSRKNKRKLK